MSCDFEALLAEAGGFSNLTEKQLLMVQIVLVKDLSYNTSTNEELLNSDFSKLSERQLRMVIAKLACDIVT